MSYLRNVCPIHDHKDFSPMFSFNSFTAIGFILRPMTSVNLCIWCEYGLEVICFHVEVKLLQHCFYAFSTELPFTFAESMFSEMCVPIYELSILFH